MTAHAPSAAAPGSFPLNLERRAESGESPVRSGVGGALVLSLFPGIGLLDLAFEQEGFCIVRGPDRLWGGDVKTFHPPRGRFDGIIGGPPCQAHSRYAGVNRAVGNKIAEDLVPEFVRCIEEAQPEWWLMENVPDVPTVAVAGYLVHRMLLDNRWLGEVQSRKRVFQFGTRDGARLEVEGFALENPNRESACLATEGAAGQIKFRRGKSVYTPRRDLAHFCELQGIPADFLDAAPFTMEAKFRVVGNGVPIRMGRALASAVRRAAGAGRGAEMRVNGTAEKEMNDQAVRAARGDV